MRTDSHVARNSFRHSRQWRTDPFANVPVPAIDRRLQGAELVDGRLVVHSLSGHERNHFFWNGQGQQFTDISLISGLDSPADSRGFVTIDYDRDGRLDIAMVNANAPLLNLYRNRIGQPQPVDQRAGFVALRFVGAKRSASSARASCRDGYGAMVEVSVGKTVLKREHRCGEGYGTQNSATMLIGLGDYRQAERIRVRWPSGVVTAIDQVPSGSLVTAYEDAADVPGDVPFQVVPYTVELSRTNALATTAENASESFLLQSPPEEASTEKAPETVRVYVTMATWCTACIEHMPQLRWLAASFPPGQVEWIGLPVDPEDDTAKLQQFVTQFDPPYQIVNSLDGTQRGRIQQTLADITPAGALPAAIVTDPQGRVLLKMAGVPTLSQLRKALSTDGPKE